jgi:hypothetical protein
MFFHTLPLEREDHALVDKIMSALEDVSIKSIEAVHAGQHGDEEEIVLRLDSADINSNFFHKAGRQVVEVLYVNDAAKLALDELGIRGNYDGTTNVMPAKLVELLRMPRFVNLK